MAKFFLYTVAYSIVQNQRKKITRDAFDNQSEEFCGSEVEQCWG